MSDLLTVEKRDINLSSKDLRAKEAEGLLRATVYGKNLGSHSVFMNTKKTPLTHLHLGNKFRLRWSGKELVATVKEIQKHPVTNKLIHVSLHTVAKNDVATTKVSLSIIGEAQGEKKGGTVVLLRPYIELRGKAESLPGELEIDVSSLNIGDHFMPARIDLPEGVEFNEAEDFYEQPLAICQPAKKSDDDDDENIAADEVPQAV